MLKVYSSLEKKFIELFCLQGDIYSSGLVREQYIIDNTNNVRI